jgi:hypothetical protein
MCRYELLMHNWAAERDQSKEPTAAAAAFDPAQLASKSVRICLRGDFAVESFEHDVEELALMITRGEPVPADAITRFRTDHDLLVLFHRGSFPQRISRSTAALLTLLRNGSLTPAELQLRLIAVLKVRPDDLAAADLADILQGLFWEGVVGIEADASASSEETSTGSVSSGEIRHAQEA